MYKKQIINFDNGLFDSFIDSTYIITMYNSTRKFKHQLQKYKPTKKCYIIKNYGYKNNDKYIGNNKINTSSFDLIHANLYIMRHAIKHNYNRILILEDDFIMTTKLFDTQIINRISTIIKSNDDISSLFLLGCLPLVSTKYKKFFRKIYNYGCIHACIYNKKAMNVLLQNKTSLHSTDFINGFHTFIDLTLTYKEPLIYQTLPITNNKKTWFHQIPYYLRPFIYYLTNLYIKITRLDKQIEPGTSFFYKINKIYDLYDYD